MAKPFGDGVRSKRKLSLLEINYLASNHKFPGDYTRRGRVGISFETWLLASDGDLKLARFDNPLPAIVYYRHLIP